MIRRPLVNDIVHSFCYASRTADTTWPVVMMDRKTPSIDSTIGELPEDLTPFIAYALSKNKNYIKATRTIVLMMAWLRTFNSDEQVYAVHLMKEYYGYRSSCIVGESNNQSDIQRYSQQGIPETTIIQQCDKLLDAERATSVSSEVSIDKSESSWWRKWQQQC